jgi:hypothetical protein
MIWIKDKPTVIWSNMASKLSHNAKENVNCYCWITKFYSFWFLETSLKACDWKQSTSYIWECVCIERYAAALSQTQQLNRRNNMLVKNLETFFLCVCVCAAYSKWLWYDPICLMNGMGFVQTSCCYMVWWHHMSGITSPEKCELQIIKLQNYVTQMLRIPSLSSRACCPESSSRTRPFYALFCLPYPLCKLVYLPSMSITWISNRSDNVREF